MTIVFSKLAQSRSILKNNCIMQQCVNIFELRDLPAHRSSDRGIVFRLWESKWKYNPYFVCPFHHEAFMCVVLNSMGGGHGSTVAFWSCPGWQYVEKFHNSLNKITIIWQTYRLNTIIILIIAFHVRDRILPDKMTPVSFPIMINYTLDVSYMTSNI